MPTAAGTMRAKTARRPPVMRRWKAAVWPVDQRSARSGVTTDMTVTAMIP